MTITHSPANRNGLANLVVDALDAGTAQANGDIQIATADDFATVLATLALSNPAFGAASGGQATANAVAADTNAAGGGNATRYRTRDRDGNMIFKGTVTVVGGGGDMQLSSVAIAPGDSIQINSFVYIAAQ
jgi:hypothetical protein